MNEKWMVFFSFCMEIFSWKVRSAVHSCTVHTSELLRVEIPTFPTQQKNVTSCYQRQFAVNKSVHYFKVKIFVILIKIMIVGTRLYCSSSPPSSMFIFMRLMSTWIISLLHVRPIERRYLSKENCKHLKENLFRAGRCLEWTIFHSKLPTWVFKLFIPTCI